MVWGMKAEIGDNMLFLALGIIGLVALFFMKSCVVVEIQSREATRQKAIENGLIENSEWGKSKWVLPETK